MLAHINTDSDPQLNEEWKFTIDNSFAQKVISDLPISGIGQRDLDAWPEPSENLCEKCQDLDFLLPTFQIKDVLHELEHGSKFCAFCNLRWKSCRHLLSQNMSAVRFERFGSNLRLNGTHPPVLTLRVGPGTKGWRKYQPFETESPKSVSICEAKRILDSAAMRELQIGLPGLPKVRGQLYFKVLREWLRDCDDNHRECNPVQSSDTILPTRLIDVRSRPAVHVKLHVTKQNERLEYLALSHPWGPPPHFCTSTENIEQHKRGIELKKLPKTFRDAVKVTRKLGFDYLWIDSLCIIQGHKGDFDTEGKRMEAIFSNAHCVLAASSANSQRDGIFRSDTPRPQLTPVGIGRPEGNTIYVCEFMDNFSKHVLESSLSQRGWAFQERVLARRTIYFTNRQCYWECGSGVRCESMAKMQK